MNYTIEVESPSEYRSDYFHNLIIREPSFTADDAEGLAVELEALPGVMFCHSIDYPGMEVNGDVIDFAQALFYATRDVSNEFPALFERAMGRRGE